MDKTIEVQALENAYYEYEKNVDGIPQLAEYQRGIKAGILHAIKVLQDCQKPLTVSSGKERELQFLTQIAGACGEGSYLHSLLSDDLVGWAERTILEGEKPDIYKYWLLNIEEWKKEASRALELSVQVVESQNEVTRLEMLLTQQKNDLQAEIAEWEQKYEAQGVYWSGISDRTASIYKHKLEEKEKSLMQMANEWNKTLGETQALWQTTNKQYTEILLLKAEVYDLTHRRED